MAQTGKWKALLKELSIEEVNPGACFGPDGWVADNEGSEMISYCPATGDPIAKVIQTSSGVYDRILGEAHELIRGYYQRVTQAGRRLSDATRRDLLQKLGECWAEIDSAAPASRPGDESD